MFVLFIMNFLEINKLFLIQVITNSQTLTIIELECFYVFIVTDLIVDYQQSFHFLMLFVC